MSTLQAHALITKADSPVAKSDKLSDSSPDRPTPAVDALILEAVSARQEAKASKENRVGVSIAAWRRMTPSARRSVGRRLVALGCPRLGGDVTPYGRFQQFLADCVDGVPVAFPEPRACECGECDLDPAGESWESWPESLDRWEPEPGPAEAPASDLDLTHFAPRLDEAAPATPRPRWSGPTPEQDLERLGYFLGLAGEDARPPAGRPFGDLEAFYEGLLAGKDDREVEFESWLDAVDADEAQRLEVMGAPEATWHPAELACGMASGHPSWEA